MAYFFGCAFCFMSYTFSSFCCALAHFLGAPLCDEFLDAFLFTGGVLGIGPLSGNNKAAAISVAFAIIKFFS